MTDIFTSTDELIRELKIVREKLIEKKVIPQRVKDEFTIAVSDLEGRLAVFKAWLESIEDLRFVSTTSQRIQRLMDVKQKITEQIKKIEGSLGQTPSSQEALK